MGASASVFGLIGAYWADLGLNYCARCDLQVRMHLHHAHTRPRRREAQASVTDLIWLVWRVQDTGVTGLTLGTVPNLLVGLTPWVDNFMHLGGFITGAAITVLMLPELRASATVVNPYDTAQKVPERVKVTPLGRKRKSQVRQWQRLGDRIMGHGAGLSRAILEAREQAAVRIQAIVRGNLVRKRKPPLERLYARLCGRLNRPQKSIVLSALLILLTFIASTLAAVSGGTETLNSLRSCELCKSLNCVEISGWWSCCLTSVPGTCLLELTNTSLLGTCNVSGVPSFAASCELTNPSCDWEPSKPASTTRMCQKLCLGC